MITLSEEEKLLLKELWFVKTGSKNKLKYNLLVSSALAAKGFLRCNFGGVEITSAGESLLRMLNLI